MTRRLARRSRPLHLVVGATLGLVVLASVVAGALTAPAADAGRGRADLPPANLSALKDVKWFKKALKPLDLKITRGMLQNLESYERDPRGTHLALYVRPRGEITDAEYVANFTTLTHAFVEKVFRRWSGLESFDICQEPMTDEIEAGTEAPPPVTQIFVTRTALDRVGDWREADLVELLAASPRVRHPASGYFVYFAPSLRDDPTWVAAATEAGWIRPTTSVPATGSAPAG